MGIPFRWHARAVACALGAWAAVPAAQATDGNGGLVCGGFETCQPVAGLPSSFGVWAGDTMAATMAQQGITPFEGAWMLHFDCTFYEPPCDSVGASGSDMHQFIDLAPFADLVAGGNAVATLTAMANRVAGDAQTDTKFIAVLKAFDGDIIDYPSATPLAGMTGELLSDSDTATWETVTTQLTIPPGATYLDVDLSAIEDIFNNSSAPAFDGHYADAATLRIAPGCPWDCEDSPDGVVGINDFLALLAQWGAPGAPCDIDGGGVGITDFLALLAAWGSCP